MARFIDELKRTHSCGELRETDLEKEVVLFGWVQSRRDHGGCIFIDLRDRDGQTQVVFDPTAAAKAFAVGDMARPEWVLAIRGTVRSRGEHRNPRMATGAVEVLVLETEVLNRSQTPPFVIEDDLDTHEDKRLEYRYLDLRRPRMQENLVRRHRLNQETRQFLSAKGFLEIETPFMVKHTPGGARNFIVPSRVHPGEFFALAESPQLYKQLLMVAGMDRYFQIVRCFRDEDLRLDRQPEFTQIDIEMSFINQDDLFRVVEGLMFHLWNEVLGIDLATIYPDRAFPRLSYEESMRRFGNDKPDLRYGLEHTELTSLVIEHQGGGIPFLQTISEKFTQGAYRVDLPAEIVKALRIPAPGPGEAPLSRKDLDELERLARSMGAGGLARARLGEAGEWLQSPLAKVVTPEFREAVNEATDASAGDVLLFQFGKASLVHTVLANLRAHLARRLELVPETGSGDAWNFLWIVDPPLFEPDDGQGWAAAHHVFTRPHDEHVDRLESDPGKVLCYRYDLVLNGFEVAGGSIRLHDSEVQRRVFQVIGLDEEEAQQKFGFLLRALQYGAPPHGGIAFGMDRLALLAAEAESLRDVIAFPKTQRAHDLMTGAPGPVDPAQLAELRIQTGGPPKE